jgi:tetratricopeptide (TPR) repeat protein
LLSLLVNAVAYTSNLRFHPRQLIRWLEAQAKAAQLAGHRQGEGTSLNNLGLAYAGLGEVCKAIKFYEQALVIDREIADRRGEGDALGNLGSVYLALGNARKAIEFYEQALVIDREIGNRYGEGLAVGNLGLAYYIQSGRGVQDH